MPDAPKGIITSSVLLPSLPGANEPSGVIVVNLNWSIAGVLYITYKSSPAASGSSPPFESLPTMASISRVSTSVESIADNPAHLMACPVSL